MTIDLLQQLEQKVSHALEIIELLRLQVEELELENNILKAEHEKWRHDLASLIKRFELIDAPRAPMPVSRPIKTQALAQEDEFAAV